MAIKNVAIAGATGNIGSAIVKALLNSNLFTVTAITRGDGTTKAPLPSNVTALAVDYDNASALASALKGQDAVISALAPAFMDVQRKILDASVAAGVQRFIPSEFGSDSLNPNAGALPVFAPKKGQEKYIEELAAEGKITYTMVMNGPFLDWGLNNGFLGLDLKQKRVTYLDGGVTTFSTTTLATVGEAVVGVLKHPEETKNRAVYVQDTAVTLRDLVGVSKQVLGEDGWTEIDGGTTEEKEKSSWDKLKNGQKDVGVFLGFLLSAIYREGYGGHFQKLDNSLFGIEELKESDIKQIVTEVSAA